MTLEASVDYRSCPTGHDVEKGDEETLSEEE